MTRSNFKLRAVTAAVLLGAASVLAQPSDQERSDAAPRPAVGDAPRPRDGFRGGQMEPRRDSELPVFRPLSPTEQEQALDFARANMPNFMEIWDQLPQERRHRLPPRLQFAFRMLLDAQKQEDQRLYDVLLKQMKLRDEFIGIFREPPATRSREGVRAKTREAVSLWIQQRELRIEQMEKALANEKERLAQDKAQPDGMIDQQMRRLRRETVEFLAASSKFSQQAATQPSDEAPESDAATMTSPTTRE